MSVIVHFKKSISGTISHDYEDGEFCDGDLKRNDLYN